MTEKQAEELYTLLGKQVFKYTSGESTSVSIETAQRILKSIDYCINSYYKSLKNPAPYGGEEQLTKMSTAVAVTEGEEHTLAEIFELGLQAVQRCVQTSKELLIKIQCSYVAVDNIAYRDTIKSGLALFFPKYQPRFGAQLCDANIDYPLAIEVDGLEGVEFLYEYLRRLYLENQFVSQFGVENINFLLRGYHHEAREYLINIFELVLQNALGLSILSQDITTLNISLQQQEKLYQLLKGQSLADLLQRLEEHVVQIFQSLDLTKDDMITYGKIKVKDIAYRLHLNLKLNNLTETFVLFEKEGQQVEAYFEGNIMPDEELRSLIDEMLGMRYVKDKLTLLKERVHSLSDLKEVMGECFAGEEYVQVFHLLLPQEIVILLEQAKADLAFYEDETMLLEWERALLEMEAV